MRKLLISCVFLTAPLAAPLACSGDGSSSGDGDGLGDGDEGDGDGGDGDTGDGDDSMGGGGGNGDGDGDAPVVIISEPSDPDCNLAGVWAVVTKTRTTAANMDQVANRWYLYALSQQGDTIEVVDSVSCHVRVEDANELVNVTISDDALRAIVQRESHRGLPGTFTKNGDSCELDFDRQYLVLGLPASYLPEEPLDRPELNELPALPTEQNPAGAEDWDMDGQLGIGFAVQSLASGTRNSVQRSYNEYESSSPNYTISLSASEFTVNNLTSISESVIHATSSFLRTTGTLTGADHPVHFTKLGDGFDNAELPSGAPLPSSSFELCKALEEEFPFSL